MKIEVEGASLEVKLTGDSNKPALMLWHGAGCTLKMWDHVIEYLKDRFLIISFENYILTCRKTFMKVNSNLIYILIISVVLMFLYLECFCIDIPPQ